MPSPPLSAVWRQVEARVHISLSPAQLAHPLASATHVAFDNLLMRYNHSLKGVVVAHIAPLKLLGHPTFIDASPFAHVAARAKLLVFNPPPGSVLVGVVKHVGPDHLGLTVFRNFHAVLPLHSVTNMFQYDGSYPRTWRRSDQLASPSRDLTAGKQIRFVVHETKATKEGLFQILASLDDRKCTDTDRDVSLGLLAPHEEIPGQIASPHEEEEQYGADIPHVDVLNVGKRASIARARRSSHRNAEHVLFGDDHAFGDVLAPLQFDGLPNDQENTPMQEDVPNGHTIDEAPPPTPERKEEATLSKGGPAETPERSTLDGHDTKEEGTIRASKEHRKRHKRSSRKHETRDSTPKRKKKRRYSDSFMDVEQDDDKAALPGAHLGVTERKKRKKSKDKDREKRKDRDKEKQKKSDKKKDKHGDKQKRKVKRIGEGREADSSAQVTQESEPPTSIREQASFENRSKEGKGVSQVGHSGGDRLGERKSDKASRKAFRSSKYENALEAVNVAPLMPSPRKKEKHRDEGGRSRAKEEGREHGPVGDTDYDPVKTQTEALGMGAGGRSVRKSREKVYGSDGEENEDDEKCERRTERESVSKRKKKRKRERTEGDESGKKKKKKTRPKSEAQLMSPPTAGSQHSLGDVVSRGLARRWQAR